MKLPIKVVVACSIECDIDTASFLRWMRVNRPLKLINLSKGLISEEETRLVEAGLLEYLREVVALQSILIEPMKTRSMDVNTIRPKKEEFHFMDARMYYPMQEQEGITQEPKEL
jgi:hypothetical protein